MGGEKVTKYFGGLPGQREKAKIQPKQDGKDLSFGITS